MKKFLCCTKHILDKTKIFDFLPLLLLRLYLVPVFWMAGTNKLNHIESTIAWFGNPDWGLGLPFPTLMAYSAAITEVTGAVLLLIGVFTRWISIPLMVVMLVAIFTVHWDHGWLAIADSSHPGTIKLNEFLAWLETQSPARHADITSHGTPIILQNGIEFAATYFVMLLTLFFYGAGKYFSIDYWVSKWYCS